VTEPAASTGLPGTAPGRIVTVSLFVLWGAVVARTLGFADVDEWPLYLAGSIAFLVVMVLVLFRRPAPAPLLHVAFALQAAIVLLLLAIDPDRDFLTVLFVLQCYQAAVVFPRTPRLLWVAALVTLIGASLVLQLGPLRGFSLALVSMAAGVVLATYVVAEREMAAEEAASERMVTDLRAVQERLRAYAGQADELAAIEQRSQVAAELRASVSATLTRTLQASVEAREALGGPDGAAPQLARLQDLTAEALAKMRAIIAELRPPV
jgi:signal transduction histidine kinase